MKKLYFGILIYITSAFSGYCQFTNGGFENWTTNAGILEPDGWDVYNEPGATPSVAQVAGHSGAYAARLQSSFYDGENNGGSVAVWGLPITGIPVSISGYWKIRNTQTLDIVTVSMTAYDSLDNIVSDNSLLSPFGVSYTNWTSFTGYFDPCTATPKTISFYITLIPDPISSSDYAELDDISLSFTDGIDEFSTILSSFTLSPSVSSGEVYLQFSVTRKAQLSFEVYDLQGRKVLNLEGGTFGLGIYKKQLNLGLNDGIYVLRAIGEKGVQTTKFAIQH